MKEILQSSVRPYPGFRCIAAIYVLHCALMLVSVIAFKKVFFIHGEGPFPAACTVAPFYFLLADITTEVYGFRESRKMLYISLVVMGICAFILWSLGLNLFGPPPAATFSTLKDPTAEYSFLFGDMPRNYFSHAFAILLAEYGNIWILSRWKILVKGKHFWQRSVTLSMLTSVPYSIMVTVLIGYIVKPVVIFKIVFYAFIVHASILLLLAFPAAVICRVLKHVEQIDTYDYTVSYNPFRLD
jgi:uncharacterized PurR-regulated membrane protein YhhQ (DUF165 family)